MHKIGNKYKHTSGFDYEIVKSDELESAIGLVDKFGGYFNKLFVTNINNISERDFTVLTKHCPRNFTLIEEPKHKYYIGQSIWTKSIDERFMIRGLGDGVVFLNNKKAMTLDCFTVRDIDCYFTIKKPKETAGWVNLTDETWKEHRDEIVWLSYYIDGRKASKGVLIANTPKNIRPFVCLPYKGTADHYFVSLTNGQGKTTSEVEND